MVLLTVRRNIIDRTYGSQDSLLVVANKWQSYLPIVVHSLFTPSHNTSQSCPSTWLRRVGCLSRSMVSTLLLALPELANMGFTFSFRGNNSELTRVGT